jgi:hypothetical protein
MDERELVAVVVSSDGRKISIRVESDSPARRLLDRVRRRLRQLAGRPTQP